MTPPAASRQLMSFSALTGATTASLSPWMTISGTVPETVGVPPFS